MTSFQRKVYEAVKTIPVGKVLSYRQVAKLVGRPGASRAVGNILNKNANPAVPCHRVVKSDGRVGGYRYGQKRKIALLKKEGILIQKQRIVL